MTDSAAGPEAVVSRWIDCFNLRDLAGMLECMSPAVRFYPLRIAGLDTCYQGHDGIRAWFAQLGEIGHLHRFAIHRLRAAASGEVVAMGEVHLDDGADPARFWARDRVVGGEIVVAHHYLTDPEIFEGIAKPSRPSRPARFPGL